MKKVKLSDYSLVGENSLLAVEKGLADADWYTTPIPKDRMRELLLRKNGPAIRDTLLWFALLFGFGYLGFELWGTWWAILPFAAYGVLYGSASDSRWHESSHGTAFKTDWMNNALYELASFMVFRESTPWRWSHTRHHSDTIIVGRDPEIAVPRPPSIRKMLLGFVGVSNSWAEGSKMLLHCLGKMTAEEKTYVPKEYHARTFFTARIYVLIFVAVAGLAVYTQSFLPLMYVGLPVFYGGWLMRIYGYTQHAGLAENVLDHRLNCRTVYMNIINRYLYWNMNYHLEHHMFPLVPYHNLAELHDLIKDDSPTPYQSIFQSYCEIIPAVWQQIKDPGYYVKRTLPTPTSRGRPAMKIYTSTSNSQTGWVDVCNENDLHKDDVIRFDHQGKTFAIYRTQNNQFYATDGICTHGKTHLAEGLVKGDLIECPKHNGRFDIRDGSAQRAPVCVGLRTYQVKLNDAKLSLDLSSASGVGEAIAQTAQTFRVLSNDNVATFIKELVLEPINRANELTYTPGDYLQLEIPTYDEISFKQFNIKSPYNQAWNNLHIFDLNVSNTAKTRRNYSLANSPRRDLQLRFNVRIATPPTGQNCKPGVGSSYVFNLKPGDQVKAIGPFGDFHIKDTKKEMVYIGGGAGMAPLRAHLAHLFDIHKTKRKVSYWYGARSLQELFYQDYFEQLDAKHENFNFHVALSAPQEEDQWASHTGFIHEVVKQAYLDTHHDPTQVEYYLCGPPAMLKATKEMLLEMKVNSAQIAFDEF